MVIRLILLAALALSAASSARASDAQPETREAWLSSSAFDGETFRYEYIAYEANEPIQENVRVLCEYGNSMGPILLKAVEVKIYVQARFDQPGAKTLRSGSLDVRKAVADCQKPLPGGQNAVVSPVAIRLPQVSISSKN